MERMIIEFDTITPMYMGGADQKPEFRISSLKGLLRFWLRAIDPKYRELEPKIFGDAKEGGVGVSPMIIRLKNSNSQMKTCYLIKKPDAKSIPCIGNMKKEGYPGLRYLAFPMGMDGGKREAIIPSQRIAIEHIIREDTYDKYQKQVAMAWWALATIGGLGSRSRRGFGSIKVTNVQSNWKYMETLRTQSKVANLRNWTVAFEKNVGYMKKWFGNFGDSDHFCLSKGTKFLLFSNEGGHDKGFANWFDAMDFFGRKLKETRENLSAVAKAGLGLPIDGKGLKVRGEKHERGSSPVMMTVVSISDKFYTLVTFTRSPVIASGEKLIIKKRAHPSKLSIDYSGIDDLYAKMKHRAIWKGEV